MAHHRDLVPLTVYLPPAALERLEQLAKAADRTTSAEARRRLVDSLLADPTAWDPPPD